MLINEWVFSTRCHACPVTAIPEIIRKDDAISELVCGHAKALVKVHACFAALCRLITGWQTHALQHHHFACPYSWVHALVRHL